MQSEPLASVVIPVWRDAPALAQTLNTLPPRPGCEIIVAAVRGDDAAYAELRASRPDIRWVAASRGRAAQMNAGAAVARGRWLVFQHADCRLPTDWPSAIADTESRSDFVAGSFRLGLDSTDWRARVIEWGVRLRVAIFGLPYGDQAIFVRRHIFAAIGGYRDIPLMEDVELVRRLKEIGRFYHAAARVVTSARRWERDGWVKRSARNLWLVTRFLLGATPAQLARRYHGRHRAAVVLMARAPWTGGKTRVRVAGGESLHAELRQALFRDTLGVVLSVANAERIVACDPPEAAEQMREYVNNEIDVVPQRGTGLGDRLAHLFEDTFRLGVESVVVVGSDLPDLPERLLNDAIESLAGDVSRVVMGPASDGGYYLIGMSGPHPSLFDGIAWGTSSVLHQTLDAAANAGIHVRLLEPWRDIDTIEDVERLEHQAAGAAPRTRAWLQRLRVTADKTGPLRQTISAAQPSDPGPRRR